jgi:hypothetical protein
VVGLGPGISVTSRVKELALGEMGEVGLSVGNGAVRSFVRAVSVGSGPWPGTGQPDTPSGRLQTMRHTETLAANPCEGSGQGGAVGVVGADNEHGSVF